MPDRHHHRIGRRASDAIMLFAMLTDAQRPGQRKAMPRTRLLLARRDDPDIIGQGPRNRLQHLEAGRMHAIIIGQKDTHSQKNSVRPEPVEGHSFLKKRTGLRQAQPERNLISG